MVFAFARDRGLPQSEAFAHIQKRRNIPFNALCLSAVMTSLLGCIFLISTATFNAISSASVVALSISYALPIIVHCTRRRKELPPRPFALSPTVGWVVNMVGVLYAILMSILFLLPPRRPVTRETMNYGGVVLGTVICISLGTWVTYGRKHYLGPAMLRKMYNTPPDTRSEDGDPEESAPILPDSHEHS